MYTNGKKTKIQTKTTTKPLKTNLAETSQRWYRVKSCCYYECQLNKKKFGSLTCQQPNPTNVEVFKHYIIMYVNKRCKILFRVLEKFEKICIC